MSALEQESLYLLEHYAYRLTYLTQCVGITYSYLTPHCCCYKASTYYDRHLAVVFGFGFVCLIP